MNVTTNVTNALATFVVRFLVATFADNYVALSEPGTSRAKHICAQLSDKWTEWHFPLWIVSYLVLLFSLRVGLGLGSLHRSGGSALESPTDLSAQGTPNVNSLEPTSLALWSPPPQFFGAHLHTAIRIDTMQRVQNGMSVTVIIKRQILVLFGNVFNWGVLHKTVFPIFFRNHSFSHFLVQLCSGHVWTWPAAWPRCNVTAPQVMFQATLLATMVTSGAGLQHGPNVTSTWPEHDLVSTGRVQTWPAGWPRLWSRSTCPDAVWPCSPAMFNMTRNVTRTWP